MTTISEEKTPVPHDPEQADAAVRYLAGLGSLELHQAETRRKKAATARNQAIAEVFRAIAENLRGRWGGPLLLGALAILGILVVGLLVLAGADLTVVGELARAGALLYHGCPDHE